MSVERIESALARLPDFIRDAGEHDLDALDHMLDEATDIIGRERSRREQAVQEADQCEGFHWLGQSFAICDACGRPAWEHKGMHEPGGLFTDDPDRVRPWKPGEADAIRAKWEVRP